MIGLGQALWAGPIWPEPIGPSPLAGSIGPGPLGQVHAHAHSHADAHVRGDGHEGGDGSRTLAIVPSHETELGLIAARLNRTNAS